MEHEPKRAWSAPRLTEIPFLMTEKCRNAATERTGPITTGTYLHCDQGGLTSNKIRASTGTATSGPS